MSARDRILSRIRRGAEDTAPAGYDRAAEVAARLGAKGNQPSPVPAAAQLNGVERLAQFTAKIEGVDCTWEMIPSMDALPGALAAMLRGRNLPATVRMGAEPDFAGLDWSALDVSHGVGRVEEPVTLSRVRCASAETGTLALTSGPDNPVTLTFLGETHVCVIRASEVVAGLDDVWAWVRARGPLSRTVNLVTGPSRSADIGQVLQLGAHGPVALHVVILED